MATVQRYVNTASTAGGDGTTNATSGSTRAYASLSEWEANSGGSATDDYIVDCCGGADTTAVVVDFSTNITTGSITIRANTAEPDGFYDGDAVISTSHYRLDPGNVASALQVSENRVFLDGLQIIAGHTSTFGNGIRRSLFGGNFSVTRCRLLNTASTRSGIGQAGSAGTYLGSSTHLYANNLVVGFDTEGIDCRLANFSNGTVNLYHNTIYGDGSSVGINVTIGTSATATVNIKGNALAGSGASNDIVVAASSGTVNYDDNATDDYDLGTTGEIDLGTTTDAWASPGTSTSSDFTVKDASSPLNFTVTGTLVSDDIRGTTRSNYSVGAFEFVSGGGITLTIDDATHGHTADGVSLSQQHQLAVQDASHAHAVDNLALTQQHQLAVADAAHAHAADNLTLSTEITLSIADALHAHAVDNITLVQQHVLVVADATHGHSADNVVLETGTNLAVADATHGHTVDNLVLTQQHVLVVADALHQHSADNVVLGGLPVAEVEEGSGGPDREESEQPAERFTNDASGWRKPKWVREREQREAAARVSTEERTDAEPRRAPPVAESLAPAVSDSGDAGVAPGLERASPQPVLEVTAPAQQTAAVDLERARIAAKVRQQRELEEIMTVLMMAA